MKNAKAWLERLRIKKHGSLGVMDRRDVPEGQCEFCQKKDELRPYGPKGEWLCFDCAMKDEKATARQFRKVVFGDNTH